MIIIDKQAIVRHKVLRSLLKDVTPCINEKTWENGFQGLEDRIYGTQTITLEISDDWKSAKSVDTCTFKTHYSVRITHYIIKGTKVITDYDIEDPLDGIFYTDYDAAVKHVEDHRKWFAIHYPDTIYSGCGAGGCRFCMKFAELGKIPKTL